MFKVIDNFLDKESFLKIQNTLLLSRRVPWYFQDIKDLKSASKINNQDLNQFQFVHLIHEQYNCSSDLFSITKPLLDKLKVKSIIRIKANLIPYSSKFYEGHFHTDNPFSCLNAIYYINTNNGYTRFEKDNKKVESKENRIVIFDSKMKHRGTNTTDQKKRIVLNINYF